MKKVLFCLAMFVSVSSFANCNIKIEASDAANVIFKYAKKKVIEKGYTIVYDDSEANFQLTIATQSRPSVVSIVKLVEVSSNRMKFYEEKWRGTFGVLPIDKLKRTSMSKKQIKALPGCK